MTSIMRTLAKNLMRRMSLFILIALAALFIISRSRTLQVLQLSLSSREKETVPIEPSNRQSQSSLKGPIHIPEWIHDYVNFHRSSLNGTTLKDDARFLLYRCDGACAGVGGRLKTMIKSLYASICSDRVLLINSPSPFPLQLYLEPNLLQWNATWSYSNFSHHVFRRGYPMSLPSNVHGIQLEGLKGTDMMDMHDVWNSEICQSFLRRKKIPTILQDEEALYRWGFHTLFLFSKSVADRAAAVKKQAAVSVPYVGIHLRTNKGENWKDPHRQFEGLESYLRCFHFFRDIHGLKSGYVAADNKQSKSELHKMDGNLRISEDLQIFHIDKSISGDLGSKMDAPDFLVKWYQSNRGEISNVTIAKQGMLDLFAELLILVDAECVIMSKSGLSYAMHYIARAPRCGVFISRCTAEAVAQRNHKYVQRLNKILNQEIEK